MAPCLTRPFSPAHAGERGGFIIRAPNSSRFREQGFPQFEDSNNPLAVELERENDPAREILLSSLSELHFN